MAVPTSPLPCQESKAKPLLPPGNGITLINNSPAIAYLSCPEPQITRTATPTSLSIWPGDLAVVTHQVTVTIPQFGALNFHWALKLINNSKTNSSSNLTVSVRVYLFDDTISKYSSGYLEFSGFESQHPVLAPSESYIYNVSGIIDGVCLSQLKNGLPSMLPDLTMCVVSDSTANGKRISGQQQVGIILSDCGSISNAFISDD